MRERRRAPSLPAIPECHCLFVLFAKPATTSLKDVLACFAARRVALESEASSAASGR